MNGRRVAGLPVRHEDHCRYTLRLVPTLNLAALNARPRQDGSIMLWYCLRAIDTCGRGVLDQEQAVQTLSSVFGYRRQTCHKHLQVGEGSYWRRHMSRKGRTVIILIGLLQVARHLKAGIRGRERFIEVSASGLPLSGQVQARRALLYNTGAYKPSTAHCNHPISRKSLEDKTGIGSRQQRRYDQVSGSHRAVRETTFGYYRDPRTAKLRGLVRLVESNRSIMVTHQLPNRYWTAYPVGNTGMLPKVARLLRVSNQSSSRGEATFNMKHRRYFRDLRSFIRVAVRDGIMQGYYPSSSNHSNYILEIVL